MSTDVSFINSTPPSINSSCSDFSQDINFCSETPLKTTMDTERIKRYRIYLGLDTSESTTELSPQSLIEHQCMNTNICYWEYLALIQKYYTFDKKPKKPSNIALCAFSTSFLKAVSGGDRYKSSDFTKYPSDKRKVLEAIDTDLSRITNRLFFPKNSKYRNVYLLASLRRICFIICYTEKGCLYRQGLIDLIIPLFTLLRVEDVEENPSVIPFFEPCVYQLGCFVYKIINQFFYRQKASELFGMVVYERLLKHIKPDLQQHLHEINIHPIYYAFEPIFTLCSRYFNDGDLFKLLDRVYNSPQFSFIHFFMISVLLTKQSQIMTATDECEAMPFLTQFFPLEDFDSVFTTAAVLYEHNIDNYSSIVEQLNIEWSA
ncbi:hypothetical protein EIN_175830 [Entamoeba invadens IP1]|uniref:hypothetical protein n=1 Tax=Entamoeba invadens IP1 TaxID=370355 RepID=UPI0002C3F1D3|nr:hypothetical protein EIN_175830 [Entamoeba invadens IP1]ELP93796.1 hypothetical protein EIN_175830 [Entamoeba invadens IP1]|eukprot:XP_004260567.1 hypothetical protein EIN_175830 [Entamoeba invadens IP1]